MGLKVKLKHVAEGLLNACRSVGEKAPGEAIYWLGKIQIILKNEQEAYQKAAARISEPFQNEQGKIVNITKNQLKQIETEMETLQATEFELPIDKSLVIKIDKEKSEYTSTALELCEAAGIVVTELK